MLGYYKRPDETRRVLRQEGLFTGDMARMDAEGDLYLVGRRKNVVICGGMNVYPEEIEEHLLSHPAVREAVVIGEPHNMLGEIPVAWVVLHPGVYVTGDDLLRYCAERLANHKMPRRIEFREQLAKTYNAKIRRFGLHETSPASGGSESAGVESRRG
jgi:long-chain acyl-CoA synthetase